MKANVIFVENDYDVFISPTACPERTLLAALLERSVRDLSETVDIYDTRDAVAWFENTRKHSIKYAGKYFSYKDCIEGLGLSSPQVLYIHQKVQIAKEYLASYSKDRECEDTRGPSIVSRTRCCNGDKPMQERQTRRESRCALVA